MAELPPITQSVPARVVWSQNIGRAHDYVFHPAATGDSVYAASRNGDVARIDNGRFVWRINAGQILSGGVGANAHIVAVGTPRGDILTFSANDGTRLWNAKTSSEVLAPPAIGEGLVVVRSGDNRLAAYDVFSGARQWIFHRPTPPLSLRSTAPPIIDGGFVFAGFPGGRLIAVSTVNGAAAWEGTVALPRGTTDLERLADIASLPVILNNAICAVAFQGRVSCFDLRTGNLVWAREMSSAVGLTMDSRYLFVTDDQGTVHCLDIATGATYWKQDRLHLRRVTAPVIVGRNVVVGDARGFLHILSREDGSFVGRLPTDGSAIVAPLQVIHGRILLQTSNGGIYSVEIE
jgi:outer membrane protein assembly factor BamB